MIQIGQGLFLKIKKEVYFRMKNDYNEIYKYEVFNDGYDIYKDNALLISQREPYGKPIDNQLTFEENCLMQLENITNEEQISDEMSLEDKVEMLTQTIQELLTTVIPSLTINDKVDEIEETEENSYTDEDDEDAYVDEEVE